MPQETDRLKLPLPLGNENVTRESINGIFEKIDAGVATQADLDTLREAVSKMDIPDASLTQKGKVQLSDLTNSTAKDKAATPSAVKLAFDEAIAAKQLGVEQKANVVAALNSIGISASTTESWAQLISKMAAVVRGTGNALASDLLSGKTATSDVGNIIGTMKDHGAVTFDIKDQYSSYTIPAGYHNGKGEVKSIYAAGSTKGASGRVTIGPFVQGSVYGINQLVSNLDFTPRHVLIKNSNSSNPVYSFSSVSPKSGISTNLVDSSNYIRELRIGSVTPSSNSFNFSVYADFDVYKMTSSFTFDWSAWD